MFWRKRDACGSCPGRVARAVSSKKVLKNEGSLLTAVVDFSTEFESIFVNRLGKTGSSWPD